MQTRIIFGATLSVLLVATSAQGEPSQASKDSGASAFRDTAPARALELSWSTGYSQAFGNFSKDGRSLDDVAGPGTTLALGVGYRMTPNLMIGGYAEGGLYRPDEGSLGDSRMWSAALGAQANWHFMPFSRWDPWVGLGAGWRGYWVDEDGGGDSSLQGLDVARVQVGAAYRVSQHLTLSPTIGVSITEFVAERSANESSFHDLDDPRPTTFLMIGTTGRFDIGGQSVKRYGTVVASR
jgi:hypothetical protein